MNSLQVGCFVSVAQSSPRFRSTHFYIHLLFQVYHGCLPPFCHQRNLSKGSTNSTVHGGLQENNVLFLIKQEQRALVKRLNEEFGSLDLK